MRRLLLFAFAALLMAGPPASGAARIRVPLWVEAKNGQPAARLKPEALRATVAGDAAQVGTVLGPDDDLMLLIVSDLTGDMTLVDTAKKALVERLQQLPSNSTVGVLRAQDSLRVLVDPTADLAEVAAGIESLPVSGRAALLDTIQDVAAIGDSILSKAAVRLAVLFVTDSEVDNYREDLTNPVINESDRRDMSRRFPDALVRERISKLDTALAALQAPVFILHLDYRSESLDEAYQAGLMRLAETTGGSSYFCRSHAEIPDSVQQAFEKIAAHYSVEVLLPEGAASLIEVTLESSGSSLNYRKRFRR